MPPTRQTIRPSMPSAGALSSNHRNASSISASTTSTISPILLARLNEKKAELANLQELKALSAQLAAQMQTLEEKLGTLSSGAEAVALVLSNWHNVLRAVSMASSEFGSKWDGRSGADTSQVLYHSQRNKRAQERKCHYHRRSSGYRCMKWIRYERRMLETDCISCLLNMPMLCALLCFLGLCPLASEAPLPAPKLHVDGIIKSHDAVATQRAGHALR